MPLLAGPLSTADQNCGGVSCFYSATTKVTDYKSFVGPLMLWDVDGKLQLDFLSQKGLRPNSTMLDMGCGSLRFGQHAVQYLEAERYFGIDVNSQVLTLGYDELSTSLRRKLPRDHLLVTSHYDASHWGSNRFDFAISASLWTHLSLSEIERCLVGVKGGMRKGGRFYASFFECPDAEACKAPVHTSSGLRKSDRTTYPDRDPFHHRSMSIRNTAEKHGIRMRYIGRWGANFYRSLPNAPRRERPDIMLEFVF